MVFLFNDKNMSLKHLCFILESKKLTPNILKIKESIAKGTISEDLLTYSKESSLNKDIKRLKDALDEYTRIVNDMQKQQQPIGFQAVGDEMSSEEQEECGGNCDEE